ncbi:MAG: HlyC/CorC family transporter, partial [Lachnospiraceae bacterium]|nr:HlyC/CorC family transporter [Lachnospiraceae bacterium]
VVYDDEENDTLNGYLVSILDRIPEDDEGTVVENNGVNYKILKVEDKTISLVRMEIVDQPNNSEE